MILECLSNILIEFRDERVRLLIFLICSGNIALILLIRSQIRRDINELVLMLLRSEFQLVMVCCTTCIAQRITASCITHIFINSLPIRNIMNLIQLTQDLLNSFFDQQIMKAFNFEQYAYSEVNSTTLINKVDQKSKDLEETVKYMKTKRLPQQQSRSNKNHQTLSSIIEWRKTHVAPVDTMGCERLADLNAPIEVQKYQTLISLMLSIQTKDQTTSMCVNRLKQYGLTPQVMAAISPQKLIEMIYECNFNRRKAKSIIEVSKIILDKGIARTKQGLMEYPGVGVKIAMIYMNVAQNQQEGIGVDTHVHRISNRLGWVKTQDPNKTELKLQLTFPKKFWKDMNIALVGFGQLLCNAKKPLCGQCPVRYECPSSLIKW